MGKIGNYIHAHYKNYLSYGITEKGDGDRQIWQAKDFHDQHKKFLDKIQSDSKNILTAKEKKDLQKSLYQITSNDDNSTDNSQEIKKFIEKKLIETFESSLGKIDFKTMNVETLTGKKQSSIGQIKKNNQQSYVRVNTILNKIKVIETLMSEVTNQDDKKKINETLKDIYKQLKGLTGIYIKDLRARSLEAGQKIIKIDGEFSQNKDKIITIQTVLNQLIKDYFSVPAINLQKGELFEYAIALAPVVGLNVAKKRMGETLEKFSATKIGGYRTKVIIDTGQFFDEKITQALNKASISNYTIDSETNTIISYGTSQDKIDINLSWGGKTIPVSAKNIKLNSSYNIHILSGSSLLYLLQDENSDFLNHYLNITSTHSDSNADKSLFKAAHDAAKVAILAKALTGNVYKRQQATTFIINDNSKSGLESVQIYDIHELVKKASDNINLYTTILANDKDLSSIYFNNKIVGGQYLSDDKATNRIANLLLDLHRIKIKAELRKNILTK